MRYFVPETSIVRKIWSSADTILFIFAGSAAEFSLNTSVDWLYFTGRLPADPVGRMFSTVAYARQIVFSEENLAIAAIRKISAIHRDVERARGSAIPAAAYLEVLFMLIDYSIRSFELLERPLTAAEKEEVFRVFHRQGELMELTGLPEDYDAWQTQRAKDLSSRLVYSNFSRDLFDRYREQLGPFRFWILQKIQGALVPGQVRAALPFLRAAGGRLLIALYRLARQLHLGSRLVRLLMPSGYEQEVAALDQRPARCPFHRQAKAA